MTNTWNLTPDYLLAAVARSDGRPSSFARWFGLQPEAADLTTMLDSMCTQGFLVQEAGGAYRPGPVEIPPAPVPKPSARYANRNYWITGIPDCGDSSVNTPRPGPAGVPFPDQIAAPDSASPHGGPDDLRSKADVAAELRTVVLASRNAREQMDYDGTDLETVLGNLLDSVDGVLTKFGFGKVAHHGQIIDYDPDQHELSGIPPEQDPAKVMVEDPGITWTSDGVVTVVDKATVIPHDPHIGGYTFLRAEDLQADYDDRPPTMVFFDDDSPVKPSGYQEPSWWHWQTGSACEDLSQVCPITGEQSCSATVIELTDEDEEVNASIHVPSDLVLLTIQVDND